MLKKCFDVNITTLCLATGLLWCGNNTYKTIHFHNIPDPSLSECACYCPFHSYSTVDDVSPLTVSGFQVLKKYVRSESHTFTHKKTNMLHIYIYFFLTITVLTINVYIKEPPTHHQLMKKLNLGI